ncbi:MAG: serine protease [Clostridiales bacterium]|nr:MAG: serine protease [Clostridiales bacterium]PIE77147.1 MAG: serine protease [Clostridiales bacterium]
MVEYKRTQWDNDFSDAVECRAPENQQYYVEQSDDVKYNEKKYWGFKRVMALVLVAAVAIGGSMGAVLQFANFFNDKSVANIAKAEEKTGSYYIQVPNYEAVDYKASVANEIPDIVERLEPSIVAITNQQIVQSFFYGEINRPTSGTGVVFNINEDSVLIVSNNHVVENSQGLTVAFDDDHTAKAELIGADSDYDIAVIKVKKSDIDDSILKDLKPVILGDSDKLRAGELAIAIGNPLGYTDTVTVGFISGVNRKFRMNSGAYMSLIQTDAAINPGNSGGALLNGKGEVIGINTVKIAETSVEGIGFAIPINEVKPIIDEILNKGHVSKPYMGISGEDVTREIAELYHIKEGLIVRSVQPDSGAEAAGLQEGDIITEVDGEKPVTFEVLVFIIKGKKVGDSLDIVYYREGQRHETQVELKERNQQE